MKPIEKIKISKDLLFFLAYTIIVLLPNYFSHSLLSLLDNAFLIFGFCFLFLKRYKPSKSILLITSFYVYLIIITFINGTDTANVHIITSNAKIIFYLANLDYFLKNKQRSTINILFYFITFVVLLDFVILLLYPNGWYFTENVYNEWTTTYVPQWLLGNKNNHTLWYILAIYLSCIRCIGENKKRHWFISLFLMIVSLVAMLLLKSTTSIVVVFIVGIGVFFWIYRKKSFKWIPNIYILLVCYLVLLILILCGITYFLSPIVEGIFGKDLTFTSRTIIWGRVFEQIQISPLFGSGQFSDEYTSSILESLAFVNAHNQYLQILWQTGIIGLLIYVLFIFNITSGIKRETNNNLKFLKLVIFFALLLKFIFEVEISLNCWMVFLLLAQRFNAMAKIPFKEKGGKSEKCKKLIFNLERQY